MKTILVVANETIGGTKLREAITAKVAGADGGARVVICVPRRRPQHGLVIYDEPVFDAARVRIDLARQVLRTEGIDAIGEVGDPDPYTAAMDAIGEYAPDEVIISTFPASQSGWLRRDLPERIEQASGLPVQHVVVDLQGEGLPFKITLVVANRTASGDALLASLRSHREEGDSQHLFIVVIPQEGGGGEAALAARARLAQVLDRMKAEGFLVAGMIADPDPYTATMNALKLFSVDDVVISTLPATRSGWLRADLVERVRRAAGVPVEHVEAQAPVGA
jgi:hypothetical protein